MDLSKDWIREKLHLITPDDVKIPKNLHIIWVGDAVMPMYALQNLEQWKHFMPDWSIRLWTNADINIHEFPEDIVAKINESKIGAQKADIMRYFIIEKYGGFYMDTDTIPYRSLTPLTQLGFELVVYHDNNVTWDYICNSPFGAKPHHPIVQTACNMIRNATLNTHDPHFQTGPYLWGRAIATTPYPEKKIAVLSSRFFDKFDYFDGKYGSHTYAASWVSR
jgi:mannosyltransferase OCH1-like enzyme